MLITGTEVIVDLLCIICLVLAVWQKTVMFSGLSAVLSALALFLGFMVFQSNVLFFPIPAVITVVSLFMALAEAINGEVL